MCLARVYRFKDISHFKDYLPGYHKYFILLHRYIHADLKGLNCLIGTIKFDLRLWMTITTKHNWPTL